MRDTAGEGPNQDAAEGDSAKRDCGVEGKGEGLAPAAKTRRALTMVAETAGAHDPRHNRRQMHPDSHGDHPVPIGGREAPRGLLHAPGQKRDAARLLGRGEAFLALHPADACNVCVPNSLVVRLSYKTNKKMQQQKGESVRVILTIQRVTARNFTPPH